MASTHVIRDSSKREVGRFDIDPHKLVAKDKGKMGDKLVNAIKKIRKSGVFVLGPGDDYSEDFLTDKIINIPFESASMSAIAGHLEEEGFFVDIDSLEYQESLKEFLKGLNL